MAMKSRRNILAVSVIAMAVAIAGCSSSDDKKTVGGAPSGPTQVELDAAKAVAAGYAAAHTSKADAEAAGEAAAGAVTDATKYSGMLDVTGESAKAIENAQKVLAAQSSAVQAVGKAEAALESAKNAKTTATGKLPEDHEDRANLMAALDAAIAAAQEQVKATKASHEGSALKAAVRAVQNPMDSDPAPDPLKTPAHHGDAVAKKIHVALSPKTDGAGLRVEHGTDAPTGDYAKSAAKKADDQGKTWAEIVGDDALVDKRIADDSETAAVVKVKAASFAGEPKADDIPDSGAISDGAQYLGAYKGIKGTIFCHGECEVKDGKLAGAWYFAPNNPEKSYVKAAGGSTYEAETLYAQYGHWLRVANGNTTVHTYALTSHEGTTPNWETLNVQANATTLKDASASYKGSAAGMSVHQTYKRDGTVEKTQSGAFTAAVTLTAKFGDTPFLGGKVSNFQGDAVNSGWSVTLTEAAVTSGGVGDTGRTSGYAAGQAGKWSATSYGKNGARPMGIFGGFNAHFTDGAAAGAYATRKQ